MTAPFADRLLAWWEVNGRCDLPWQHPRTPYRVWVAEIMLQQTRVETVAGYFDRFMQRFPDVHALAAAELDEVMALWSGLGYYARARNLHKAAGVVVDEYGGRFPDTEEALAALPGIGRSTAAAIVAQAFDKRAVILDGNVKRVLARHAGVRGWPGRAAVERRLWEIADERTPPGRAADYTQAIMDLGAMLCTRRSPRCGQCPVSEDCVAARAGIQHELPGPKPRKALPERRQRFVVARDDAGRVLLVRRPPTGIWGGLWCLPEAGDVNVEPAEPLPGPETIRHVFTHFALEMRFDHAHIGEAPEQVADSPELRWFTLDEALAAGLPRPVRRVLEGLE